MTNTMVQFRVRGLSNGDIPRIPMSRCTLILCNTRSGVTCHPPRPVRQHRLLPLEQAIRQIRGRNQGQEQAAQLTLCASLPATPVRHPPICFDRQEHGMRPTWPLPNCRWDQVLAHILKIPLSPQCSQMLAVSAHFQRIPMPVSRHSGHSGETTRAQGWLQRRSCLARSLVANSFQPHRGNHRPLRVGELSLSRPAILQKPDLSTRPVLSFSAPRNICP